jgi:hypothetical protein
VSSNSHVALKHFELLQRNLRIAPCMRENRVWWQMGLIFEVLEFEGFCVDQIHNNKRKDRFVRLEALVKVEGMRLEPQG